MDRRRTYFRVGWEYTDKALRGSLVTRFVEGVVGLTKFYDPVEAV